MSDRQIKIVAGSSRNDFFHKICSLENLLIAWREFRRGKRSNPDVQLFEYQLEDNLFRLHESLLNFSYTPGPYQTFLIADPKLRRIHKASVRDRVLHQAVYRVLYQVFDPAFIHNSFSCRNKKGTHRAIKRLEQYLRSASRNFKQPVFALQCDIRKFFESVDQEILFALIKRRVACELTLNLIKKILVSFPAGLPLGNVTSQLFANIYLNELDQFVKRDLKIRHHLRYCDDFVIVGNNPESMRHLILPIRNFLGSALKLDLHERKITIRKWRQGIDYLGYVARPHHRVLRTKTKKRIFRRAEQNLINDQSLPSYLGILRHCRGGEIERELLKKLC